MQNADTMCEPISSENPIRRGTSLDKLSSKNHSSYTMRSNGRRMVIHSAVRESHLAFNGRFHSDPNHLDTPLPQAITMAEFVTERFIPEFVMTKGFAGRTHFRAILKHIMPPETVAAAFGRDPDSGKDKLTTIEGWPYLDQFRLPEITTDAIQELTARALAQGYSIQTTVHIRNVIRSVFSYAIRTGYYFDQNPAAQVRLPIPARTKEHILNFAQLRSVMNAMGYPEKEMALFALLTGMNVGEICGLHWKDVNLSNTSRITGLEVIPPRTIAVRTQSHRGKLSLVADSRKRLVRVPRALIVCLSELRKRKEFSGPQDLVLVSRNGTAIHAENVAARRLKVIGASLGIPWLTWSTFYRTRSQRMKQAGTSVDLEFEKILQLE